MNAKQTQENCKLSHEDLCDDDADECVNCEDFILEPPTPPKGGTAAKGPRIDDAKTEGDDEQQVITENRVCENCDRFGGYRADHRGKKVMCGGQYRDETSFLTMSPCHSWIPKNMMEIDGYYFSTVEPAPGKAAPATMALMIDHDKDPEHWREIKDNFGTPIKDFLPSNEEDISVRIQKELDRLKVLIDKQPSAETEPKITSCGIDPVNHNECGYSPFKTIFQELAEVKARLDELEGNTSDEIQDTEFDNDGVDLLGILRLTATEESGMRSNVMEVEIYRRPDGSYYFYDRNKAKDGVTTCRIEGLPKIKVQGRDSIRELIIDGCE